MSLSSPFIRRPIATTLLAVGLAIAGIVSFNLLPVAPLPQVDFPTISVQAGLPGGSPEIMATSVATPLERQLGRIAGITEMTSSSTLGTTRIIIQFDMSRDIDGAARDVQAAINASMSQLPANLPMNPTYRKVNPADSPIMIVALTSDSMTTGQLYDTASTVLQQKLAQVEGVGEVIIGGSSLPAVRVELNPTALNNYNIGLNDVSTAIANANVNQAKGQMNNGSSVSQIYANDQLFKAKDYAPLIIRYQNNSPVRISDVAEEVTDSVQDIRNAGFTNGKPAVLIILFKQPGANIINTVDQVKKALPQLRASIPATIDLNVTMDRTRTIRTSLHDIEATLVIAMLLVIFVTYLFLGSVRAMLIPGVAVPLSLLGTFAIMKLLGYSLDNLSLMALTISTGFVVDDAVVVLENISRHIEEGVDYRQAAFDGAKEVGFTVLSMSVSLIAVFTPILLMGGIVGRLFREFAVTLSVAILVSLVVSLTVTPMMCAVLLRNDLAASSNRYTQFMDHVRDKYAVSLRWALASPRLMVMLTLGAIVLTGILFVKIPKGFFPQQDTGRIVASIQADQNISFQAMRKKLIEYINVVRADPGVENVVAFTSGSGGSMYVTLKELSTRKVSADDIINRLRGKVAGITGSNLYLQAAQDITIGGRRSNAQFQYTISADNLESLNYWAPLLVSHLSRLNGIADVNSDQLTHGLQSFVKIDHDAASRFGITPQQIDAVLYSAFGQRIVSTMYTVMNQYRVVMEVAPKYWQFPTTLDDIYVLSTAGKQVPLASIANFSESSTLLSVNHQGQAPAATLSFNLLPGISLGDAVSMVGKEIANMHLPEDIVGDFSGSAQAFKASLANEPYLVMMALLAVYIVLGILYESLIHPITILSTLPSAGVGALLALIISGTDLSIIAMIGIILLIGIVKKNAIMMIDFALATSRHDGKSSRDAIYEAAVMRFRPIMMTTMAAIFGALPLVLGFGLGSELRRPLGIAIVGGLVVSQMLTLYTTPVIYLLMERFSHWCGRRWDALKQKVSYEGDY